MDTSPKSYEERVAHIFNKSAEATRQRMANSGQHFREAAFDALYDKQYAPGADLKRLRDMTGAEVRIVATAMNTLCTAPTEARALVRVSEAVGLDRVVKKVMKKDEFVAFCSAATA